jgi:aryl sulfotransferase
VTTAPDIANTRVYRHHHLDSTRWDHVAFRDDDIVITTPYKTGTTWTQQIVCSLLHGPDVAYTRLLSPWIDARFWGPIEPIAQGAEAMTSRRFMKSHLALDGMRWDERVSYIVVGRDSRDVFMSLLNHYSGYTDHAYARINEGAPKPLPRFDGNVHAFWRNWISRGWFDWESDGWPFWSHHHHQATWWTARDRPNVLFVHYGDLKADLAAEVRRIADFLGLSRSDDEIAAVAHAASFDEMRARILETEAASQDAPPSMFEGGMRRFMFQGTNGRWRDVLGDDELAQYEAKMQTLDPALRTWLEGGRHAAQ